MPLRISQRLLQHPACPPSSLRVFCPFSSSFTGLTPHPPKHHHGAAINPASSLRLECFIFEVFCVHTVHHDTIYNWHSSCLNRHRPFTRLDPGQVAHHLRCCMNLSTCTRFNTFLSCRCSAVFALTEGAENIKIRAAFARTAVLHTSCLKKFEPFGDFVPMKSEQKHDWCVSA